MNGILIPFFDTRNLSDIFAVVLDLCAFYVTRSPLYFRQIKEKQNKTDSKHFSSLNRERGPP